MTKLLPLLAIMALLGLVSVAHAQSMDPTVSTIAITSAPGTDNTYATGDTITVGVTFSEAVTVTTTSGTPRITLDIGEQPRYASYTGAGSVTGQILFQYTVLVSDTDADGVSVVANSLALDGGTIRATGDSTDATLTHTAMSFSDHKVDTNVRLLSNTRVGNTTPHTISATQSAEFEIQLAPYKGFTVNEIALNVTAPSDTLQVTVKVEDHLDNILTYSGSVTSTGWQTFTYADNLPKWPTIRAVQSARQFFITIEGSGAGSIQVEAAANQGRDQGSASGLTFFNNVNIFEQYAKIQLKGYEGAIPEIVHSGIFTTPENGTAYAVGERVVIQVVFSHPVTHPESPSLPFWLGDGSQHRREAPLFHTRTFGFHYLAFAYTVTSGDMDIDGIYISADPLGDNAGGDFHFEGQATVPADTKLAANQLPAGYSVDGSRSPTCAEVFCSNLKVGQRRGSLGFSFHPGANIPYEQFGVASALIFEYDSTVHFLSFLNITPSFQVLQVNFASALAPALIQRGAFDIGDRRFLLREADDSFQNENNAYFSWDNHGLTWAEEDVVAIKVIETATATFDAATYDKTEGDTFDVTVTLDEAFTHTQTIPIKVEANGGATEDDYSGIPEDLTFAPGDTEKTFTVTVTDDTVDDDDESITLSFDDNHIRPGGTNETGTITLTDNDDPQVEVEFGAGSYTVAEGGTQSFTVELSADPERTLIIPIDATGLGGATTADYSGVPETVTFTPANWDTPKSFTFAATQDGEDDDEDQVKLTFGTMPDDRVDPGATDELTFSITDDDDPFVTVEFGASAYTVAESDVAATLNVTENEVEVTVTLSADPERTVIIPIERTDLGGVSSADYSTLPTSVTFNAGDTSKSFTFTATHDTVDDDDESVKLTFGTMPDGRVSEGATDVTTVTITDDDHPEVTVEFGQDEQRVGEGETINVTVKLSADPEREVMIPVTSTVQGMASAADYSVPTSVTFNNGEIEKTIVFMAVDDMVDDDDESVKLGFGTSLPVRVTAGTRTETTININDDDDPEVTVQFGASTYTVAESDNATTPNVTENRVVVTVTLDKDPERTIIMPITPTMVGTASAADYSGVPPSVTFNSGDTSMTFTFSATEDVIDDDGEGVKLTFGTMPDPRVSAGTTNETTVSITDDDTADIVISPVSLSVDEENDSSYSVRLDTEPTVNVTVTISGHSGTDLTLEGVKLSNDALTFTPANWGTPQTVTVEAAHDDDGVADNETLTHTASGAEYAGLTKALPVTVNDNDPLGISISPLALTVDEGESADYAVSLDTEPTVAVTVTISGHTGTDLTLSGSTLASDALTFTAADWDTPQTITVSAGHDDDIGDDSETLTHTGGGGEYEGLAEGLPVLIDDNTGNLRLVGGTLTDEDGNLCEGRLEIYYNGEWGTICDDYWTGNDADVACRALGFVGGSVEDWGRFRTAVKAGFPAGAADQQIMLDDLRCGGKEWNLLECTASQVGKNNCRQREDVGLRCIKNSAGAHVISLEISPAPGGNGKYDAGETVTVTVVWSEPVNVTVPPPSSSDDDIDPPHLHLAYGWPGAPTTEAVYSSGSGTARTAFTATVEDRGNAPYSRVDVYQESLSFGEGTITSVMTGNPVILGQGFHRGPETGEQAEAVTITGVPTFNDPGEDGVFGAGEMVKVTFIFSQPVQVDTAGGTPSVEVLLSGTSGKQALYLSGSGAGQLVFGYTLAEADGEHSSLLVDPNSLALNGGAIRDVANNLDADIGHQGGGATFARPVEATAPQLQSATVDGSTLTLTFDETLDVGATPSSTAFTVNVNGVEHNILIVGLGGANVLLTLSTAVESGDTVTVDYAKPSGANVIKDTDGNEADSFTGQAVTNNTAAPVTSKSDPVQAPDSLNVARHESGKLSASWDAPASGPTPTGYTVQWKESGDDWAVKADVSEANVKGASHVITGLTDGTEYAVRVMARKGDDDSAPSGEITGTPRETAAPTVSSAAVDGTTLTITFSEGLTDSPAPATTTFTVTVGGNDRGVDVVTVSGSTVTLTLATAVSSGDQVTVDYTVPTDQAAARLKDLNDNPAESFSGQQVTNNTVASLPAGSLLTVAHFADNGLETVVLASFDSGGDTTFYSAADSRWGESGKLVEGDVDLNENTRIVRVMAPNSDGSLLRLNDNGGLTLRDFFGPSGTGADLTVWVQTS